MSEKNINARVIHKHDIETNWKKANNFIPKVSEIIVYDADIKYGGNYDYPRIKIGDGETNVNDLPFTVEKIVENILDAARYSFISPQTTISLSGGDSWKQIDDNMYSQDITNQLTGKVTEYSKIDLQPTPEQLKMFHEKDVTFTTINDNGKIEVYVVGVKPTQDYEIQITITEVSINA